MNIVILGCGRSGSSLLSSLFAGAGFFAGSRLHPPRDSNPAGFFESDEINQINNRILEGQRSANGLSGWVGVYTEPIERAPDDVVARIEEQTAQAPWCFKDPRFSYTLSAWDGWLGACTVLCVFREPAAVVASLLKECAAYYPQYDMTQVRAEELWRANYRSVLERIEPRHRVCWVSYEDLLDGVGLEALETRLGVRLDRGLVRPELDRQGRGARSAGLRLAPATHELHTRLMTARL